MERLSLCGSAQKRLAMVERRAGNRQAEAAALESMQECYGEAETIGITDGLANVFYPALNRMAAACVLHAGTPAWHGFEATSLSEVRRRLCEKVDSDPDFWSEIGVAELDLYEALSQRRLASRLASIRAAYGHLHRRIQDQRSWGSVRDQLDFVLPAYIERMEHADPREAEAARTLLKEVTAYTA
jgi:hypothetical protein